MYKTANEPTQQHTANRYNSMLRWTAMKLRLQRTVTQTSIAGRPFRGQMQLVVAAVCWYLFESFGGVVERRGKSRILYLANTCRLFSPYWQN